jgi:hypothetical protein
VETGAKETGGGTVGHQLDGERGEEAMAHRFHATLESDTVHGTVERWPWAVAASWCREEDDSGTWVELGQLASGPSEVGRDMPVMEKKRKEKEKLEMSPKPLRTGSNKRKLGRNDLGCVEMNENRFLN